MSNLPPLKFGAPGENPDEIHLHLAAALVAYAHHQIPKTAAALTAAEAAARQANLHRQAAKIRTAIAILAQGGKPRLLTRPGYLNSER